MEVKSREEKESRWCGRVGDLNFRGKVKRRNLPKKVFSNLKTTSKTKHVASKKKNGQNNC